MLLLLVLLLFASGFFSGSETALFSLTRHQRSRLARSESFTARTILKLIAETRGLLITLLLGNMTVNVLYFVVSAQLLIKLSTLEMANGFLLAALSIAPLLAIVLLGEVMPKLVASRLPDRFATLTALPLFVVHRMLAPIRVSASFLVITPLSRLLTPPAPSPDLTPDEFEAMLRLSRHHGVIDHDEQRVLEQVLELSQLKVRNLMVPRVDIQAFDLDDSPQELMALIRRTRLRHIPVYRDSLDNVVGMIYSRQAMLALPQSAEDLKPLVRQVKFLPELQRADQTLIELRKTGTTFALAVDEYGGTAGLITLEDLVEHLVGNIPGAYEQSGEVEVEMIDTNRWRVDADLSVHEWADVFGKHQQVEAARTLASASTIGGLIMAKLGKIPDIGDEVALGNIRLAVDHMDGHRIETVIIELYDSESIDQTPAEAEGGEA
ncbi:MAG: hemolysin family protein [Planctomycetota bacterium]